ncbi:MAG TPA: hypothetical protein VET85_15765, partial [Stellaceae bacterium]|nr:hypothetical protein [Stellaceae bacterium]
MATPKALVVYYSRSGTTRRLATAIAQALQCDVDEILDAGSRTGVLGYMRSLIEAFRRRPAAIQPAARDVRSYDLVIVGTPVWASAMSSPVRAYLLANKARLRDIAFFCTFGGRGSESAFAQMQELAGKAPRARCALTTGAVRSGSYGAD